MKEDLVKKYLSMGRLLSPEALDMLAGGAEIKATPEGCFISKTDVARPYRILKSLASKKTEITAEDFVRFYRSKHEKMKCVITSRLQKNFISLNKLDSFRNEVYVIGIIRDIRENSDGKAVVELEDPTCSVPAIFEKDDLAGAEVDDVVAVRAISAKDVLFGKQVMYPDVPLRPPQTGSGKACFVSNLNLDEAPRQDAEKFFVWMSTQDAQFLFVAGDVGDLAAFEDYAQRYCATKTIFLAPGEKDSEDGYPQLPLKTSLPNIVALSNPSMVELNGVKVLLTHNFSTESLRKRYVGRSKCILDDDFLVLDDVPDIVCCGHQQNPHVTNYKSITIACSGSLLGDFHPVVIDFSTRQATQEHIAGA